MFWTQIRSEKRRDCPVFLTELKQFHYRKLWNRTSSLGIWKPVFSRRELSVFSSWVQLCLNFWRIVQTHLWFLQRKPMQIFENLPETWEVFIFSLWRWVGNKLFWEERDTDIDTALPDGADSRCAVVDITLSSMSIFGKAPWTQWPWEHYMTHLIYKNKLFWTLDPVCQTNGDFYQDLSPYIEWKWNVLH